MRTCGTECVILVAVLMGAASAAAQDEARASEAREAREAPISSTASPNDRSMDEGRVAFQAGRRAFETGRYAQALEDFERAYELTGHPDMLYNIGHTAERLRQDERALSAFEGYLDANPESPARGPIEARMAILRRAIENEQDEPLPTREGEAAPLPVQEFVVIQAPAPSEPSPVGWVLTGVGAAVALTGVGFLVGAEVRAGEVRGADDGALWPTLEQAYADANNFAIAGGVLAGVGAATAALGLVLALTAEGDQEVAVGPGGVQVRGRF
ncbi:MAG: tol-pal system YbgF family protein [Sandaracinaceae bacterium]